MKYEVWTYFEGSKDAAQEIVNDWNEIAKTKSFRLEQMPSGADMYDHPLGMRTWSIEGEVDQWVLDETSIEMDFMVRGI